MTPTWQSATNPAAREIDPNTGSISRVNQTTFSGEQQTMFYGIDAERANMPVKILWLVMGLVAAALFFTLPEKNDTDTPTPQIESAEIVELPESTRMKSEIRRLQDEVRELKAQMSQTEAAE